MLFRRSSLWITVALLVGTLMVAACAAPTQTPGSTATPLPTATTAPPPSGASTATAVPPPTVAPSLTSTAAPTATVTVAASPTSTVAPTATATRPPTATATPQSGAVSTSMVDFQLENLTVRVGTTVTWTNSGGFPHTTTSGTSSSPSGVWTSPVLQPNQSFSFTFTQTGVFPYFCQIHPPDMRATVTVTP